MSRADDASSERWVPHRRPSVEARIRLFCFACAGGAASRYARWAQTLPASIEVCALQLPGRETRMAETCLDSLHSIVSEVAEGIEGLLDLPFALFGHSLGGLVAFELARDLRHHGQEPLHLFVAGTPAPSRLRTGRTLHRGSDQELLAYIRSLDGTPDRVLDEGWLREAYLPVLRADLKVFETYVYARDAALSCPLTAMGGREDQGVARSALDAWSEQTRGAFEVRIFDGGHFFLDPSRGPVCQTIAERLSGC